MTKEQLHDIEVLNRLERQQELMWLRGENIPNDLLERIGSLREKIKQAISEP